MRNVVKEDVVKPSYEREQVLANAPAVEEGYFEVPKVIE
jgi:aspartyl-tRNA(Asn)/glutamyl-tRNA(Gln) amidotransferase subunit C